MQYAFSKKMKRYMILIEYACYIMMTFVKSMRSHKLLNTFLMQVHLGVGQRILMREDGQEMNNTCSINYYI